MNIEEIRAVLLGFAFGDAFCTAHEMQPKPKLRAENTQNPPYPVRFSHVTTSMLDYAENIINRQERAFDTLPDDLPSGVVLGFLLREDISSTRDLLQENTTNLSRLAAIMSIACLVKLSLGGFATDLYLRRTLEFVDGVSDEFDLTLYRVGQAHFASKEHGLQHIGKHNLQEETVALALYCVLQYPDDYVQAIQLAANSRHHRSEVAAITGAIMAARSGITGIPATWQTDFDTARFEEVSQGLAKMRGIH